MVNKFNSYSNFVFPAIRGIQAGKSTGAGGNTGNTTTDVLPERDSRSATP